VELDVPERQQVVEPARRFPTRVILAALVAMVVAAAAAAGLALTRGGGTTPIGSGVVVIETNLAYQGGAAAGTGMVLTPSGEILTNNHVIRGATDIKVRVPSTGQSYAAQVVGYDVTDDVAVLQASGAGGLKTVSLGSSSSVHSGQSVLALGNAGGTGHLTRAPGTVITTGRSITVSDDQGGSENLSGLIETNAAVRPGDSGGPLLNSDGQVIGMDTAASVSNDVAQTTSNQGYAIPIDKALSIAEQIHSGNGSDTIHVGGTAFLGVEASSDSYAGSGAVVSAVVPGSAAESAGITAGDLITSIGGQTVSSPDTLSQVVVAQKPGDSIDVVFVDQGGATQTTSITLASGPPR
jgi:S1-C subfamily serine protease